MHAIYSKCEIRVAKRMQKGVKNVLKRGEIVCKRRKRVQNGLKGGVGQLVSDQKDTIRILGIKSKGDCFQTQ